MASEEQARNRYMLIQATRILGFGIAVLGLLMTAGAVKVAGDANWLVGCVFIALGLIDGFLVPLFLARQWRTPPSPDDARERE